MKGFWSFGFLEHKDGQQRGPVPRLVPRLHSRVLLFYVVRAVVRLLHLFLFHIAFFSSALSISPTRLLLDLTH